MVKRAPSQDSKKGYLANQTAHILRRDTIRDYGTRIVVLDVEAKTVFASRADKILDEIHAAARLDESPNRIGTFGFYDNFSLEKNAAIKGKIPERREPCRRVHQLVSDY